MEIKSTLIILYVVKTIKDMEKTYIKFKEYKVKHQDCIILMRCGDFYETYDDDAKDTSSICGVTLNHYYKNDFKEEYYVCGFPYHALDTYLPKLIRAGKRVAIADY